MGLVYQMIIKALLKKKKYCQQMQRLYEEFSSCWLEVALYKEKASV